MTVTTALAGSAMGYVESTSTSYASALSGAGLSAHSGVPLAYCGQSVSSGTYFVWQTFLSFGWTAASGETQVAAYLRFRNDQSTGTSVDRAYEVREYDWGASVDTADWRTPAELGALDLRARVQQVNRAGAQAMRAGLSSDDLATLDSSSTLRYVVDSLRNRTQQTPSGLEWNTVRTPDHSTGPEPTLYSTSCTQHFLDLSLGGQVQLSDGTHAYLEFDDVATSASYTVEHHDGSSASTVYSYSGMVTGRRGAQCFTLVADADDNLYIIDQDSSTGQILHMRALTKGSGYSWTAGTLRTATMPTYEGRINNVAAAWHSQGGAAGTIVVLAGRQAGPNTGTQVAYALVNCDYLLTGSGSALRGSGDAVGLLIDASAPSGYNGYTNETGTLLDVCRASAGSARGFVVSTAQHAGLSDNAAQSVGRYVLNSTGTGFASTARYVDTYSGYATKDADAKSRMLPISASQCVTVNASASTDFGITVKHRQNTDTSTEWTTLADVRLDEQGLSTMPAASTLAVSAAWDAVHDPANNRVWVYYFDAGDDQRLMRTHVDLDTGLAGQDEVEVDGSVGSAGGTRHAIRVHRGELTGQQVLVTVADETSGGVHSLVAVVDELNLAPEQPVLSSKANFDATADADFVWTFRDPNSADTQSAFQLEIYDDATDTLVHDTTKTTSSSESYTLTGGTITNGDDYRWRVKTWDALDEEGPWSDFGYFATSASGNVTVVSPATDNDPSIVTADVTVQWSVSGATQDDYRVVVVKTSDSSTHSDSGWVTSTDVTYTVTGMDSGTEYRVEVTIRDTGVESSTGTRLITPDYSTPDTPSISVSGVADDPTTDNPNAAGGYLLVSVSNPAAGTNVSSLDGTFETGVSGWEANNCTLVQSSAQAYAGTYSALMTVTGSPTTAGFYPADASGRATVEANRAYTLSAYAYSPVGYSDLRLAIDWYDVGGSYISSSTTTNAIAAATWEEHTLEATAPTTAVSASYGPDLTSSPPTGTELYVDELHLRTSADTPFPSSNQIWRRRADSGDDYLMVAGIDPDSSYRDYLVASGISYEYYARAVTTEATADSATGTASVSLHGVWLHDPDDAESTARRLLYGRAQRSYAEEVQQVTQHFAGRTQPVTTFGEYRTDTFQVTVDVPEGTYAVDQLQAVRDFHRGREAVVVRDNRGRVMVATLAGYSEDDQAWGTQVAFTATRVDAPDVVGGEG